MSTPKPPFRIFLHMNRKNLSLESQFRIALQIPNVEQADSVHTADLIVSNSSQELKKYGHKDVAWIDNQMGVPPPHIKNILDPSNENSLRELVEKLLLEQKLTFGQLKEGKKFIAFPLPGDNSGHGGYLQAYYLFLKTTGGSAVRLSDGVLSSMPESMEILKVD